MSTAPADHNLLTHDGISDDELAEIAAILSMWRPINMSAYKDTYIKRRVAIRMRSTHCRDAGDYCNLLRVLRRSGKKEPRTSEAQPGGPQAYRPGD